MRTNSGSPWCVSVMLFAQIPPMASNDDVRVRRSWSSGPESGARGCPAAVRSAHTRSSRAGSRYGNGVNNVACTTPRIAVTEPIPSANVSTARIDTAGVERRPRHACRTSWNAASQELTSHDSRTASLTCCTPPISSRAERRAWAGVSPAACLRATSSSK